MIKLKTWKKFLLCILMFPVSSLFAQIAVVVNLQNSLENISLEKLSRIYEGRITRFDNDIDIVLGEEKNNSEQFYRAVLDKNLSRVKKYWISFVLSGKSATPPEQLAGTEQVELFLKKNIGGICFIDKNKVTKNMKVISVNEKLPAEKGYPIR